MGPAQNPEEQAHHQKPSVVDGLVPADASWGKGWAGRNSMNEPIWKKVDGNSWDRDGGKAELERLSTEGYVPVEPLKKEPIPNVHAYMILCEAQVRDG